MVEVLVMVEVVVFCQGGQAGFLGRGRCGFVLPFVPVLLQPLGNLPVAVLVRSQGGLHHQVGRPLGLDVGVDGAVAVGVSVTVLASGK